MTPIEFRELVKKMRAAQKGFFKAINGSRERSEFLSESKRLESQVDHEIHRSEKVTGQETLFS